MDKEVILVGGFHEVIELCETCNYKILGIIDSNLQDSYLGYPILGGDKDANSIYEKFSNTPLVISPDLPSIREKLYNLYLNIGFKFETIISPFAKISKSAVIGQGCIIQQDVNVSSCTIIGNFVKLNTKSNIMHDCSIKDFVTIAPNAVILGRIIIGKNAYVGANATILPELEIGEKVIIGAGAVVTKNVLFGKIVKGVPAK